MTNGLDDKSVTPLMRQYQDIKKNYPDVLLLFQVGDFYELFFEDARIAAAELAIALTQRGTYQGKSVPLCGVPLHVADHYISKLVKAGFKVAICDQISEIKPSKIIERKVSQLLTPGTLTDSKLLDAKKSSYIASLFSSLTNYSLFFAEFLTGNLFVTKIAKDQQLLEAELSKFLPDEVLIFNKELEPFLKARGFVTSLVIADIHAEEITDEVQKLLGKSMPGVAEFFQQNNECSSALALLCSYLKRNHETALAQFKHITMYTPDDFLLLDAATQRNLELVKNGYDGSSQTTLFALLDQAMTAMGSRLLKRWLLRPLVKKEAIEQRLDAVDTLMQQSIKRESLQICLKAVGDLERIVGRIALKRAQIHDYIALKSALALIPDLAKILFSLGSNSTLIEIIKNKIPDLTNLQSLLEQAINDEPGQEVIIKHGFNHELDKLRAYALQASEAILELERSEQKRTGISSLKIRYSGVHGYAIEITKSHLHAVPDSYKRLQTLVGKERFTISALKELEHDITRAKTDSDLSEKQLFETIKIEVELYLASLSKLSQAIAYLDSLLALAEVAALNGYVRPKFNEQQSIVIKDGKHPVLAAQLGNRFIANHTNLTEQESLWIITGPNMGGKSTYLRQVALICLMAQMGSFVPAAEANLPILDRIFTRIGAGDHLAQGKSTFFVEMEETAFICKQATERSLIILDEVGRGTSTTDGLSIAQAVAEYIYKVIKARCLFATHYHELTALNKQYTGIISYHAATQKIDNRVLLLHKIVQGVADSSFGLEVAQLVQLPESIINRARLLSSQIYNEKKSL